MKITYLYFLRYKKVLLERKWIKKSKKRVKNQVGQRLEKTIYM